MRVVATVQEMIHERTQWMRADMIGFVPTMGYFHEGHLSLFRRARAESQVLIVSIFVNPSQFAPHEDLMRYPRDLERDLQMLETIGVDVVFTPTSAEIYPPGFTTYIEPKGPLADQAEGALRPGHFRGVSTIVLKLFQLVQPNVAYLGQKDAQQVAVITQMVADLNLPVKLRILPTIREDDGLAMSSRNVYLNGSSRLAATALYRALQAGRETYDAWLSPDPYAVSQAMINVIAREPLADLDYAEVRDARSFLLLERIQAPALLLIAARIGSTHLIDNFLRQADGSWDSGIDNIR